MSKAKLVAFVAVINLFFKFSIGIWSDTSYNTSQSQREQGIFNAATLGGAILWWL